MDFFNIVEKNNGKGKIEIFADYQVQRSKDIMVRGRGFYAIWDDEQQLWSTDEYEVQRLVDAELRKYTDTAMEKNPESIFHVRYLGNFSSNSWVGFRSYLQHISDASVQLDENLTFSNTEVKKTDYVSRRLPYPLSPGDYSAYDEMMSVLYAPEEREKLEWAIGAIVSGDSKNIQKFLVLYGSAGTGKSTILNIIQKLFEGYYTTFEAKALTQANNSFSTEAFRSNPLVAIQHDGDLSKIEDNTKLNSIISHEDMVMNEKFKPSYTARSNAFLFMGTNKPVKITDAKSGIIRRLIDVQPTGEKIAPRRYQTLYSQIDFELGAIAYHCLEVYREMGKDAYSAYRPVEMMLQTDVFFNFIEANYDIFKAQNGVSVKQAHELYKNYCDETGLEFKMPQYKLRDELKNYFGSFEERVDIDGVRIRSWYSDFKADHFKSLTTKHEPKVFSLVMDDEESLFDREMADAPAQYATRAGTPIAKWESVTTKLSDLDTSKLHYVKTPITHIVIDFDLTDATGEKSAERNLEAASIWPSTYAEYSKSGHGIHLHYNYEGDVNELSRVYEDGIEVKVFTGDSSLRRRLSKCNNIPVATISSGLPLKEKKPMINTETIKSEKALRDLIGRNMRKEIHPGTKPSMDFIFKILEEAHTSGLAYDVTDLRPKLLAFANNSTNQSMYCIKLIQKMQFKNEVEAMDSEGHAVECKCENCQAAGDNRVTLFDVEVFPNLFVICWKQQGDKKVVRMINPTAQEVETLLSMKLVGFNNRKYDNHVLYGAFMGYNNEQLYKLSQKLINNEPSATFGDAYNLSYADLYDISSKKQSLKKFEIELGIKHMESNLPWDQPVPEDKWTQIADYCANDVEATEAVLEDRKQDFVARQILSDLSGLPVNSSTQQHAARIMFGTEKHPQSAFNYPNLKEEFPGYTYEFGKSTYRGEITGEGGLVHAEPGMYYDVALLDIISMHPTSIEQLNLFGGYTQKFSDIKAARIAIKRGQYDDARGMLNGKLTPYLTDPSEANKLSDALKLVINSIYGYTSARFENPFRDPRNVDNVVAKRGALFMVELKHAIQSQGFSVVHVKTDSVKIPNATREIIDFVMEFGEKYGYVFEHEDTYEKFCLVNDAVYIAKTKGGRTPAHWTATGSQFAEPYVFKTLFSHEPIEFKDMCLTKSVTASSMFLDFTGVDTPMVLENGARHFVGRSGQFTPVISGGGTLLRVKDDKDFAVAGTKGYKFMESEVVKTLGLEDQIDTSYFRKLVDDALAQINKYGDSEAFTE